MFGPPQPLTIYMRIKINNQLGLATLFVALCCCSYLTSCDNRSKAVPNNKIIVTPTQLPAQQDASSVSLDKSPMDMIYYPVEYTKQQMLHAVDEPLVARVIYSRPKKDNRVIFGDVIKYNAPWRLGANEATEIEFFKPVSINDQQVRTGRYIMYCIPTPDEWTVVLNSDLFTWGLKFDTSKDVYRFKVPVNRSSVPFERFTMEFQKAAVGIELHIAWDSTYASVPIRY